MTKQVRTKAARLRRERGALVAQLIGAKSLTDELAPHRVGNLERKLDVLNADIRRLASS